MDTPLLMLSTVIAAVLLLAARPTTAGCVSPALRDDGFPRKGFGMAKPYNEEGEYYFHTKFIPVMYQDANKARFDIGMNGTLTVQAPWPSKPLPEVTYDMNGTCNDLMKIPVPAIPGSGIIIVGGVAKNVSWGPPKSWNGRPASAVGALKQITLKYYSSTSDPWCDGGYWDASRPISSRVFVTFDFSTDPADPLVVEYNYRENYCAESDNIEITFSNMKASELAGLDTEGVAEVWPFPLQGVSSWSNNITSPDHPLFWQDMNAAVCELSFGEGCGSGGRSIQVRFGALDEGPDFVSELGTLGGSLYYIFPRDAPYDLYTQMDSWAFKVKELYYPSFMERNWGYFLLGGGLLLLLVGVIVGAGLVYKKRKQKKQSKNETEQSQQSKEYQSV